MGILDKIKKSATSKKVDAKKETKESKSVAADSTKEVVKKAPDANIGSGRDTKDAYRVLVRPLVTEKSTLMASHGKYVFSVDPKTNKIEVKKAIEALYGVKVDGVNILNQRGKVVFFAGKMGKRKNVKKAIVTLAKGQKITVFEGV